MVRLNHTGALSYSFPNQSVSLSHNQSMIQEYS